MSSKPFPFAVWPNNLLRKAEEVAQPTTGQKTTVNGVHIPPFKVGDQSIFTDIMPKLYPHCNEKYTQHDPHLGNSVIEHTVLGLPHLDTTGLDPRTAELTHLAYTLHDVGKERDALSSEHPRQSAEVARPYLEAQKVNGFGLTDKEHDLINHLLTWHDAFGHVMRQTEGEIPRSEAIHRVMASPPRGLRRGTYADIFRDPKITDLLGRIWQADIEGIPGYGKSNNDANGNITYLPNTFHRPIQRPVGHEIDRLPQATTPEQRHLVQRLIEEVWRPAQR